MLRYLVYPRNLYEIAQSYLSDIDRLWKKSPEEIDRFRNKMFKKLYNYSKKVPLYREKFKGIGSVGGIDDIETLPFVHKSDFREWFPDGLIDNKERKDLVIISTSGSTGKPVSIYRSLSSFLRGEILSVRVLKAHGLDFKKDKIMVIGDFAIEDSYDHKMKNLIEILGLSRFTRNIRFVPFDLSIEEMCKIFGNFKPKCISGYPRVLAELTREATKKKIDISSVTHIMSSGYVLDPFTKEYLETTYGTKVIDVYGSIEIDTAIFQCAEGLYHVSYDLFHIELLDDEYQKVAPGEVGRVIATRLYGRDTPIIRYTGLDDLAVPEDGKCSCGLDTPIIKSIEGRRVDCIVLPDGRFIPPLAITSIPWKVMRSLNSKRLLRFQIIQQSLDKIELLLVLDEGSADDVPDDVIIKKMKEKFCKELGVEIDVKLVDDVRKEGRLLPPVVISKVWREMQK